METKLQWLLGPAVTNDKDSLSHVCLEVRGKCVRASPDSIADLQAQSPEQFSGFKKIQPIYKLKMRATANIQQEKVGHSFNTKIK